MSATSETEPCRTCGAPMYAHESFCPKCRSPRLGEKPEVNRVGLALLVLIIVGGIVGGIARVYLDMAH